MKLKDYVNEYLNYLRYSVKLRTYLFYVQINETYISKFKGKICEEEIRDFILNERKSLSYSTTKTLLSIIKRTLKYSYDKGKIKARIGLEFKLPNAIHKKVEALQKNEQSKLEDYIFNNGKDYYIGILLSLYTGLRLGEVLALTWENINLKDKLIFVEKTRGTITENHKTITIESEPKTKSSIRDVPIAKNLLPILKRLKACSICDYVVCGYKKTPISPRAYQKSFENLLVKLNIKHYGFHSLRHTFATRLLENGIDIKTISELLGHSSATITLNKYVHTNLENKRYAIDHIIKKSARI